MQNNLVRKKKKKYGPRTTKFYNNLSFNKIQIGLVRGPLSHPERSPFLVTIDGAADGVKDLVQSIVIPSGFLSS